MPIDTTAPRRLITLFCDPYTGIDQGADAAEWLTAGEVELGYAKPATAA